MWSICNCVNLNLGIFSCAQNEIYIDKKLEVVNTSKIKKKYSAINISFFAFRL